MAARYKRKHLDLSREKIKVSQLLNRLQDNGLADKNFLDPNQIRCIEILLRKTLPDLSAVEHQGEVQGFVMRIPEAAATTDAWEQTVSPSLARTEPVKH
jgi:hypothetical protein